MLGKVLERVKKNILEMDYQFLIMVYALLACGLIMVLSASSPKALADEGNSFHYFNRQLFFAILGTIALCITSCIDYRKYKKWAGLMYVINIGVLVLVLVVGDTVKGATRWLSIGGFSFQPTEFTKLVMIIFYAWLLAQTYKEIKKLKTLCVDVIFLLIVCALIMLQPHMSCTILIVATVAMMLFVAGLSWKHIGIVGILGVAALAVIAFSADYRRARLFTFVNPFVDIQGDGWQIVQSIYAISSGGLFGVGLGQSRQKFTYMSEPQNDFIFAILAEELGLLGCILVILMFVFLVWRGIKIALEAPDMFGKFLVTGIIGLLAIQTFMNIAVVISLMPVTGVSLPFFSYGGTALLVTMTEMGIVLNVSKHKKK